MAKKEKGEKKQKSGSLDITTIAGIVVGFVVIVAGILMSGSISNFISGSSVFIVLGGTLAAIVASFPLSILKNVGTHMKVAITANRYDPAPLIDSLVEFSQIARKNGLLALEEKANQLEDPFYKRSLMLIIDAVEAETVKEVLEAEIDGMAARHDEQASLYVKGSAYAPAFGMIGTLVGLINMLKSMNLDEGGSDQLGVNMSVALITTLYGCLLANLIFGPIAKKLELRNNEEILYRQIIVDGVLGIQAGDNPKSLKERLVSSLPTNRQLEILDESGEGGGKKKKKKKKKGDE